MSEKILGWNRHHDRWLVRDADGTTDEPTDVEAYCPCGHLIFESRSMPLLRPEEGKLRGYLVMPSDVVFKYEGRRNIPDVSAPSSRGYV